MPVAFQSGLLAPDAFLRKQRLRRIFTADLHWPIHHCACMLPSASVIKPSQRQQHPLLLKMSFTVSGAAQSNLQTTQ
jgi:hypothetical protein